MSRSGHRLCSKMGFHVQEADAPSLRTCSFVHFKLQLSGTVLAVSNATNVQDIFDSLDVSATRRLRPMQLQLGRQFFILAA